MMAFERMGTLSFGARDQRKILELKNVKADVLPCYKPALIAVAASIAAEDVFKLLEAAIAIATKNPFHSTYLTESYSHHWAKRCQFIPALKSAVRACMRSASESQNTAVKAAVIATVVSVGTLDWPPFVAAHTFSEKHVSKFTKQYQFIGTFFNNFQRAVDSERVSHRPIFSELKSSLLSSYLDPDCCVHDAIELLLKDSPKNLQKLPAFLSLVSASGFLLTTLVAGNHLRKFHPWLKNQLPLIENKARVYTLDDCNLLTCVNRLAMRTHGVAAICLAELSPALDGDGSDDHNNPGVFVFRSLMAVLRRYLHESHRNRLVDLHRSRELKQLLRLFYRIYRAAQRCLPQIAVVMSSGSIEDIRNRLRLYADGNPAAALTEEQQQQDEEVIMKSILHLLECFAHISQITHGFPSPRQLLPVICVQDVVLFLVGCDVNVRSSPSLLRLVHQMSSSPWLRESSNVAQFSRQILTWLNAHIPFGSSIFLILRELLFERAEDFRSAVMRVIGPMECDATKQSHACIDKVLTFFREMLNTMQQTAGVVCPFAHMLMRIFHLGSETDVNKWLEKVTCRELFAHLLQTAQDIDVPFRVLGLCVQVALTFISNTIVANPSVPAVVNGLVNKSVIFLESLQLLHPDWTFLNMFDLYRIALGAAHHALHLEAPTVRSACSSAGQHAVASETHISFLFGGGSTGSEGFFKNFALKMVFKRAVIAAETAVHNAQGCENVFWTDAMLDSARQIEDIVRSSLPQDVATPISTNHPSLPSIGSGTSDVVDNNRILRILKDHNDCIRLVSEADLLRMKSFSLRCKQLLELSREYRKIAADENRQSRHSAAAAAARSSAFAQQVLSNALGDEVSCVIRILIDVLSACEDVRKWISAGFHTPLSDFIRHLLEKHPEIERLARQSITARQLVELLENTLSVVCYKFTHHSPEVRQRQSEQALKDAYENWYLNHCQRREAHQNDAFRHTRHDQQQRAGDIRALDEMTVWFLVCDIMRMCAEGATSAQKSQSSADGGFLRSILNFTNKITGHESENVRSLPASKFSSFVSSSREYFGMSRAGALQSTGPSQHRIATPHLAEIILERPEHGTLLRCGIELLRLMSNIELHLNSKIPVVMIERIMGEVLSISPHEHKHLYEILGDEKRESYEGVKQSYKSLSLEHLAVGAFASVTIANIIPFNVALYQLYFDDSVASRTDILPLAYPLGFTFFSAGAVSSSLYFFVKQCQHDSTSGQLNWQRLVAKIFGATALLSFAGLCFGQLLERQEVAAEFFWCIFLMVSCFAIAFTVFVRNLLPVLQYGKKLVGM